MGEASEPGERERLVMIAASVSLSEGPPAVKQLLLSEVFPPQHGGSGRWFWELYRRVRLDVVIAANDYPGHGDFDATHNLDVVRLPLSPSRVGLTSPARLCNWLGTVAKLRKLTTQHGITFVHAGRIFPEGWLALSVKAINGVPYLAYVHGEELPIYESSREMKWMAKRAVEGANCFIANSRNTAEILIRRWRVDPSRVHVMHPGADAERFRPTIRDASVRERLRWGDRPVILTASRLQRRKGHDVLIRALPRIASSIPDVLYAVVGDGAERERLEDLASSEGVRERVLFHGELCEEDLVRCFQQCDLFVLPNREVDGDFEGFGIVLVEAQACERPVIAGTSGGTGEALRVGETGLLVPCERPGPLAEAVISLLSDESLRRSMGVSGRKWVVENLDWKALSLQAERLFESLHP